MYARNVDAHDRQPSLPHGARNGHHTFATAAHRGGGGITARGGDDGRGAKRTLRGL